MSLEKLYRRGNPLFYEQMEFVWDCPTNSPASSPKNSGFPLPLDALVASPASSDQCSQNTSPPSFSRRPNYWTLPPSEEERLIGKRYRFWTKKDFQRAQHFKQFKRANIKPDQITSFSLEDLLPLYLQSSQPLPRNWEKARENYSFLPSIMQKILYLRDDLKKNTKAIMKATGLTQEEVNKYYWQARFLKILAFRANIK